MFGPLLYTAKIKNGNIHHVKKMKPVFNSSYFDNIKTRLQKNCPWICWIKHTGPDKLKNITQIQVYIKRKSIKVQKKT